MSNGRNVFFGFLVLGLLSCSEHYTSKRTNELPTKQEIQLVLTLNTMYVDTHDDNQPFFTGIKFVQQQGNKVIVSVDPTQISIDEAKASLNRKGFKVEVQRVRYIDSKKKTPSRGNPELDIQIPEITFPNIFKALLVFYK